jgi:hypothetical protein
MPGKRVQFDEETWNALDLLARDRMQDFQQLAEEAFSDLLRKHGPAHRFEDCPTSKPRHRREAPSSKRISEAGSSATGPTWAQVSRRGADGEYSEGMRPAGPANRNSHEIEGGPNRGTLVSWGPPTPG